MSRTIIATLMITIFASTTHAGQLAIKGDRVTVEGAAAWGKSRSIWARGQSLVLVFPGRELASEVVKANGTDSVIREVRLNAYHNRVELELKLSGSAMDLLSRVKLSEKGEDLVIAIPPAGAPVVAPEPGPAAPAPAKPAVQTPLAPPLTMGAKVKDPAAALGLRKSTGSSGSLWALFLVIALGAGAAWWLRRRRRSSPLNEAHIEVISSRTLYGKQRLVMVEAGGELLLLGCTDRDIRLLRAVNRGQMQDQEENAFFAEGLRIDRENAEDQSTTLDTQSFVERLNQRINQTPPKATQPPRSRPAVEEDLLDEKWAEDIIRLRRGRKAAATAAAAPPIEPQEEPENDRRALRNLLRSRKNNTPTSSMLH